VSDEDIVFVKNLMNAFTEEDFSVHIDE